MASARIRGIKYIGLSLFAQKIVRFAGGQLAILHPRLMLIQIIARCLPFHVLPQVRTQLYRWAGFSDIEPRVYLLDTLDLRGRGNIYQRLHIGMETSINHSCHFDLNAPVYIGKKVGIGNNVFISTSTHTVGSAEQRCGKLMKKAVTIGDGVWVGSHVSIMAGVTIGPGAVIAAGSVVMKDVPANAQVAGNPARVIAWLDKDGPQPEPTL